VTRDPAAELEALRCLDLEQRDWITRNQTAITHKQAEIDALQYRNDVLLCSVERRRMAMDGLLDELLAAKERATA
jgi:hypothetical protein